MDKQNVTVMIHGREYNIASFRDKEYTVNLARYCDYMMKKIDAQTKSSDYLRVAILSLLQMTHNFFEEKERNGLSNPKVEEEIERLIKLCEATEKEIVEIDAPKKESGKAPEKENKEN